MTNSKAYISLVLILAFLFSSYVLAEDLSGASPVEDGEESYVVYIHEEGAGGGVDIPVKPIPIPPFNIPSAPPPPPSRHIRKSANLLGNAEARESKGYINFPQASRKTMLGTRTKKYTDSFTCDPSMISFVAEKCDYASAMRHHNMVRLSGIDGRAFRHALQAKTSSRTKNDGKTNYGVVSKVQDVGEETNN